MRHARHRSGVLCRATMALGLLLAGLSPSFAVDSATDVTNPHEGDPAAIARGSDLFAARCSFCHGGAGKGAKGPCLTCGHFKRGGTDLVLFSTVVNGRPGTQMGSFANTLSADDIWDIIAYLRDETRKRKAAGELDD